MMVSDKQAAEYAIQAFMHGVDCGLSMISYDLQEIRNSADSADETIARIRDNVGDYMDILEAGAGAADDSKDTTDTASDG